MVKMEVLQSCSTVAGMALNDYFVECPKVNARPQAAILFCHEEETESSSRSGGTDVTLLESLDYELLHGLLFRYGYTSMGYSLTLLQIDGTVPWSVWW